MPLDLDFTAGAPGRFVWYAPEPVASTPAVTFIRPDGVEVGPVDMQQPAEMTVDAVQPGRRLLTASGALPDPAGAGDVWLITNDRQGSPISARVTSSSPGATIIELSEPLPTTLQADAITVQFAAWWAPMTADGALAVAGAGRWTLTAGAYAIDGTQTALEASGAYRAIRRLDTGLTEAILLSVHPELIVERRRHDTIAPRIAEHLRLIRERLRSELHPRDLSVVVAPGDFIGVHIDMVRLSFERDPALRDQERRAIDQRWADLMRPLLLDVDGDGRVDPPARYRRDGGGRNLPDRVFLTH